MHTETSTQYESFPSYRVVMTLSVSLLLVLLATGAFIAKTWVLPQKAQAASQVEPTPKPQVVEAQPEPKSVTKTEKENEVVCEVSDNYPETMGPDYIIGISENNMVVSFGLDDNNQINEIHIIPNADMLLI